RSELYVKDGDTVIKADGNTKWAKDQEYRLIGVDTPETTRGKCPKEIELGTRAAARLIALLDSGPIDLAEVPCSCPPGAQGTRQCNVGRRCGRLSVGGKDVGETLISEGLGVPFHCGPTSCPKLKRWCSGG